ncbi:hypothetical protein [Methylophilus sp. 5]|uniref:hypothetical protein n=1 Tax=Methylophilus sp. 5 TaxID=1112274 RepID=UPI00048BD3B2|nr:hypothetical protein [Methylophilus sp. 5]
MAPKSNASTRPLLWLGLLLTLGLVYWQWAQDEAVDVPEVVAVNHSQAQPVSATQAAPESQPLNNQPASQSATAPVSVAISATESTYFTRQLPAAKMRHALFVAHEWLPPPPKPQPPPPPEAPPLPYIYVGSMQDVPGGDAVILMQQKKMVLPKLGSNVTAQWRLDREDMQAVYFTYLPLNKVVVLSKTKTAAAAGQRQAMADADNNPQEEMLNQ